MHAAGALFILSFVSTYVSYFWYGQSLRYLSPVQAAILGNLEPVVGTLLCWWLWNENFSFIGWVGCALVIGSVLLLTMKRSLLFPAGPDDAEAPPQVEDASAFFYWSAAASASPRKR